MAKAKVKPEELPFLADISLQDARRLLHEVHPDPFIINTSSMANILVTFNITLTKLKIMLENALIAKNAANGVYRPVALSSEPLGKKERARSIQDGLDALFIQLNKKTEDGERISNIKVDPSAEKRLREYLAAIADELGKKNAEYLIS